MCQGARKILSKDVTKKHQNNLIIGERKANKAIKIDTNVKVYPFHGSHNYTNSEKILCVLNTGLNIRREFKRVNKDITFTSSKNLQTKPKISKQSYYLIVIIECTNGILHTMVDILVNQRKEYWNVALNISKTA